MISSEELEMYVLGDINANMLQPNENNSKRVKRLCNENSLFQLITEPTRVTDKSSTCLDLVFVSHKDRVIQSGVVKLGMSDHYMPFLVRKIFIPKKPTKIITTRNFKNYDKNNFVDHLHRLPWTVLEALEDPEDQLSIFLSFFNEAAKLHAPLMQKKIRGYEVPWRTGEINELIEKRDYIKLQAVKKKDRDLYEQYKCLKNMVNREMKKSQGEYYQGLILENIKRPDKLWKAIKQVMPSATTKEQTTTLCDDDGTHKDPKKIAECFNNFFSTVGSKLSACFRDQALPANPYPEPTESFTFDDITIDYTLRQLKLLDTTKSSGLDYVHAKLLKDAAPAVAGPLCVIMNSSLRTGQIPADWKRAKVTAIYKDGDSTDPSNYRPISVLSICMKIFERAVHQQLEEHLTR
jgi:hypothetical protein